jgi:hypothetical protein
METTKGHWVEKGQVGLGFDGPQEKQVGRESCSGLEARWAGAAGIKGEKKLEMDWANGPKKVSGLE